MLSTWLKCTSLKLIGPWQIVHINTTTDVTCFYNGAIFFWKTKMFYSLFAVLPSPWFTRQIGLLWNCLPQVKKLLGGWPKIGLHFIRLPAAALFSSNLPVFCQFREFLSLFQCPRTFFSSISGIKTSWRTINIDCLLHVEVNNLIVSPPNWVIKIILQLKSTQNLENWAYNYMIKIGLLWSRLPWAKKPICSEVLATLSVRCQVDSDVHPHICYWLQYQNVHVIHGLKFHKNYRFQQWFLRRLHYEDQKWSEREKKQI